MQHHAVQHRGPWPSGNCCRALCVARGGGFDGMAKDAMWDGWLQRQTCTEEPFKTWQNFALTKTCQADEQMRVFLVSLETLQALATDKPVKHSAQKLAAKACRLLRAAPQHAGTRCWATCRLNTSTKLHMQTQSACSMHCSQNTPHVLKEGIFSRYSSNCKQHALQHTG